jgi:uncharacterized membrane protein
LTTIGCCKYVAISASGTVFKLSAHFDGHVAKGTVMDTIVIVIILLILFGGFGGGYYGYSHYGMGGGVGILGVVLIIAVVLFLFGRGRG